MDSTLSVMLCSKRRPWLPKFRSELGQSASLDEIEALLRVKLRRWRGLKDLSGGKDAGIQAQGADLTGFMAEDDSDSMLELE
jgi:hypothetical protein